ncbi:MAG: hypothetical protein MUP55_00615 [Candidatus Aenigmarchaeota archaeon]|nr:hypothetical protein [Candidatus Aenigmarchaeota archaeon]
MSNLSYWLDKIGASGVLLGPAETVSRLVISGKYTGTNQIDEGMGILTGGLAAWNGAKYIEEQEKGIKRSPLVHTGRVLEVGGPAWTETNLLTGNVDNIFRAFGPAALGIPIGAFLEYVAGPVHEKFSKKYKK